jgi:hypothetical protein
MSWETLCKCKFPKQFQIVTKETCFSLDPQFHLSYKAGQVVDQMAEDDHEPEKGGGLTKCWTPAPE